MLLMSSYVITREAEGALLLARQMTQMAPDWLINVSQQYPPLIQMGNKIVFYEIKLRPTKNMHVVQKRKYTLEK